MYLQKPFNCTADYALETLNSIHLEKLENCFENLPVDPYLDGGYRFRRLFPMVVSFKPKTIIRCWEVLNASLQKWNLNSLNWKISRKFV
jgi:hypothetical protein